MKRNSQILFQPLRIHLMPETEIKSITSASFNKNDVFWNIAEIDIAINKKF